MAAAVYEVLGDRIAAGSVNVKYEHTAAAGGWHVRFGCGGEPNPETGRALTGPIAIAEAGHPVPDAAGLAGAEQIARLLTGLAPRDLVLVLISGGGSALLPLPVEGITLADYQELTNLLLRSGADITEINVIRKHCSRLQGGQLARLAAPAQIATLILSDVVGTPLDAIASGPTVPDRSAFGDAWAVLERYGIVDRAPGSVREHLRRGAAGEVADTPKPGDSVFARVNNVVVGDNAIAGRAAVEAARTLGYNSALLSTFIQGEAREVGRAVAGLAQGIATGQSSYAPPACLVLGGETTVTIRGSGKGGRNQELALSAAVALSGYALPEGREVAVVSLGTDGTDGPTDAAGGIGTLSTVSRARAAGLDVRAGLANNDSYSLLGALGDLIITGPTQTNVNDLMLVVVR
jgi:hydroxypyruvate reductase